MNLNFETLREYERIGKALGQWKGYKVYSGSKRNIKNFGSKNAYILYDDERQLYIDGYVYGKVGYTGNVEEYSVSRKYSTSREYVDMYQNRDYMREEPKAKKDKVSAEDIDEDKLLERIGEEVSKMLDEACKW